MKWKAKTKQIPSLGDELVIVRFAYFPVRVKGYWVWLEKYNSFYTWEFAYDLFGRQYRTWKFFDRELRNEIG